MLHEQFGSKPFRFTDVQIAALMVRGFIQSPSEYNWRWMRGYYCSAMADGTGYGSMGHLRYPGRLNCYIEKRQDGLYELVYIDKTNVYIN